MAQTKIPFIDLLNQLNTKQREAVEQIDGPMLVIAGPGTGKTQILATRIANILTQTDTTAESILCLTYTDAGTIAMRKRLLDIIGTDAYRIDIFTFHAFSNSVIQQNLDYFGIRSLDAVSELEQIKIVHEIIDNFTADNPLKRYTGDIYYETSRLLNLYQAMKRENWNATLISNKIDTYLEEIKTREEFVYKRKYKEFNAGDLKQAAYDKEVQKMQSLRAAAVTFDSYQEKLKQTNRYDFADMILWVIEAFNQKPDMLAQYQEKYLYFLVDEYQDTSGAQNDLLFQLLKNNDKPNVFAVGDDDQSIYRFQGANIENINLYINKYHNQDLTTISLEQNYRSSQVILDASKALIGQNTSRLNSDKTLLASNAQFAHLNIAPQIFAYQNEAHQSTHIAMQIAELHKQGVPLNEIAVLFHNHKQAEDLITWLQQNNININTRKRANAFDEMLVKKMVTILRYLNAELTRPHSGEYLLFEILHYHFFNLPSIELARFANKMNDLNNKIDVAWEKTGWREALKQNFAEPKPSIFIVDEKVNQLFVNASQLIEKWIKDATNLTLQHLIKEIINDSGLLFEALQSEERTYNMQLLHTFFDFIKNECARNTKTALRHLIQTIDTMEQEGIQLPSQRLIYNTDGVNFITTHSSKGLEFEHVFIIGCNANVWEKARKHSSYTLPDTLFEINKESEIEEKRRLFYVGMTRAKKQLYISYLTHDNNSKDLEKSQFVAELEEFAKLKTSDYAVNDIDLTQFELTVWQTQKHLPQNTLFNNDFVNELLEKYTLSVTHLSSYLKCPTAFYFNSLIKVPAPLSASMTFGSAVHYALEKLFRNMNSSDEKAFASTEEMIKDFAWFMRRNEQNFTPQEFKLRMEYGEQFLPKYYDKYINDWNKITSVERSLKNVVVNNVPLNGKLDKLEFDGNIVNVVDYKTGSVDNAREKFKIPNPENVVKDEAEQKEPKFEDKFGGDYWRQAVFYKILMDYDKDPKTQKWEMRTCEFDFVEPDKKTGEFTKVRVPISPNDVNIVLGQIDYAYAKIKAKEFSNGCGKEDCHWCEFTKNYYASNNFKIEMDKVGEEEE
jgi:DNA helicase II / ATP-dependent DNA helicase PcrA